MPDFSKEPPSGKLRREEETEKRMETKCVDMLQGKVLLVDDEQINLRVGRSLLEKIGFEVEVAVDGRGALKKTAEKHYDLVFMDIQMPVLGGIKATEILRRRELERGDAPQIIIAMTASFSYSTKNICLAAGMDGYISKPIEPQTLIPYLRSLLAHGASACRICAGAEQPQPSIVVKPEDGEESSLRTWNRQLALEYVSGDEELLLELMKIFLEKKDFLMAAVIDAFKKNDGEELSFAAHAFKGAVNHFAAEECQQLARIIESRALQGGLKEVKADIDKLKNAADALALELLTAVTLHVTE